MDEESGDPLLENMEKEQLFHHGKHLGDEDKGDVELKLSLRISRLSNTHKESQLQQENIPLQETSSCTSIDKNQNRNKETWAHNMDLILPSEFDVNSYKNKHLMKVEKCEDEGHDFLSSLPICQIIRKFLDYVGTPLKLQCLAMYLMVDGEEAHTDLQSKEHLETTKPHEDSGIHSNASEGPKPHPPKQAHSAKTIPHVIAELQAQEDLLVDGISRSEEDDRKKKEEVKKHPGEDTLPPSTSGTGQLRAKASYTRFATGLVHVPRNEQRLYQTGLSGPREVNSAPGAEYQPNIIPRRFEPSHQRISCGSQKDLLEFVNNIGKAPVNTGIFLGKFSDVLGLRSTGNFLTEGQDYHEIHQFQEGKDVFFCQSTRTQRYFVTKKVPIIYKDFQSERQDHMRGRFVLYRPQQVDLVVSYQDSCPLNGLAMIYGLVKRKLRGKEYGEMFMEYCEANTLYDKISYLENLDVRTWLQLAQKLIDIVQYLHEQNIIHGDLKLENIGMRADDGLAVFDFEGAKHPSYEMNTRGTFQYMPPWFRQCYNGQQFESLKTLDMWSVGVILLRILYRKFLFLKEYAALRNCNTCENTNGVCSHVKPKFLTQIENNYDIIQDYLPAINPLDGPLEKRLACLIHGLLSAMGPEAQFTAQQARDALDEGNVVVQVLKNGQQTVAPIVVQQGMEMKHFITLPFIQKLKGLHHDLQGGMWFSSDRLTPSGLRNTNIDLNHRLTECCVIHVHSALPHPPQAQALAQALAPTSNLQF